MNGDQGLEILHFKDNASCMADLARASGLRSVGSAVDAYTRLAPELVEAMAISNRTAATADSLLSMARAFTWVERETPEVLFANDSPRFGNGLTPLIFGGSLPALVSKTAASENLSEPDAGILLEVIATVSLCVMARHPDNQLSGEVLTATLAANTTTPLTASIAETGHEDTVTQAAPVRESAATAMAPKRSTPAQPVSSARESDDENSKMPVMIGAAVAFLLLAGGAFAIFGGGSDEPIPEASEAVTTDTGLVDLAFADPEDAEVDETPSAGDAEIDDTSTSEPDSAETGDTASGDDTTDEPEPASDETDRKISLSVPMVDIVDPERGASGVLNFTFDTVDGDVCYSVQSINIQGPYRTHIHVGTADEKGGIVVDMGALDSGDIGCIENLPVDTNAILANKTGHYAELHDISEEWTIRGQLSEAVASDSLSLSVPMVDIVDPERGASGVLNFEFDTVTGEVCYSVESINIQGPYRTHIHVGTADEKGGIVVDMGALDSGDIGCIENLPVDTNAILANKTGHYAELHDISEEWTIRGQLSDAIVGDASDQTDAQVDSAGGGASIVLDGGTVYLEGAVPDQVTADELFGSLANIDAATPVVNNLTVDPGAPLPSGRVVIADAVFFGVNSDAVKAIDEKTLSAITALALSRDDWILTVVGHTDSVGPDVANLELSLRRATALRDLLASQGVPDENLRIRGAGETAPIGDNETWSGRAKNRRIEFEFTPNS